MHAQLVPVGKTRGIEHRHRHGYILQSLCAFLGRYDNFFDLGGDSLKAIQIMSKVRNKFGFEIPLRCLFESSIIADFAPIITQKQIDELNDEEAARILAEVEGLTEEELLMIESDNAAQQR